MDSVAYTSDKYLYQRLLGNTLHIYGYVAITHTPPRTSRTFQNRSDIRFPFITAKKISLVFMRFSCFFIYFDKVGNFNICHS